MKRIGLGVALLLAASPLFAQESPAPAAPQGDQPWRGGHELRPGDKWARVLIDLDEHGRSLHCRIAETSIRHNADLLFHICNAFMSNAFRAEPVRQNGIAVRGTIERRVVLFGQASEDAYQQARRQRRAEQRGHD